jgi:hypothetical protein
MEKRMETLKQGFAELTKENERIKEENQSLKNTN